MKICFIVEHFPPHVGGVEIVFETYAKILSERGHDVRVATSNSGGLTGIRKMNGFEVDYIDCKSFFGHPVLPESRIEQYARWADIIHTTTYTAALPAMTLAKKFKKPCILTVHEALGKKWFLIEKNPLKALGFLFFEWLIIKKNYAMWHAVSKATKQDLLKYNIPENKIKLIYNGVDHSIWNPAVPERNLNELFGFESSDKIFLYNGRPGKTKGVFILLEAIKKIKRQLPANFKFGFILSQKPENERKLFEELVKKYNLSDILRIANSLPYAELPSYRKSAFALIVPSLTEGFGFAAAETSSLGVPIISSNAGSLPEVASGRVIFFENGDADDLVEKIILATENKFENIPEKKFDWNETIDKVEEMYREII